MSKFQTVGVATADSRRQISFARYVSSMKHGDQYIVEVDGSGVIKLTPAKTVKAVEK